MENLAEKSNQSKVQHVAQLQKIINMCQTLINEDKEDSKGPEEVVHLVEKFTHGCLEHLEIQTNLLMELMRIPKIDQNLSEMKKSIEKFQSDTEHAAQFLLDVANEESHGKSNIVTLENLINNPGLVHLAEGIFRELDYL